METNFIRSIGCILRQLCDRCEVSADDPGTFKSFVALQVPSISISDYAARLHKYMSCSDACFVIAMVYIDRLIQKGSRIIIHPFTIHRLLFVAVVCACKFWDDEFYKNSFYSRVGGVAVRELNRLETDILLELDFDLHVDPDTYNQYYFELTKHIEQNRCNSCSGGEVTADRRSPLKIDTDHPATPSSVNTPYPLPKAKTSPLNATAPAFVPSANNNNPFTFSSAAVPSEQPNNHEVEVNQMKRKLSFTAETRPESKREKYTNDPMTDAAAGDASQTSSTHVPPASDMTTPLAHSSSSSAFLSSSSSETLAAGAHTSSLPIPINTSRHVPVISNGSITRAEEPSFISRSPFEITSVPMPTETLADTWPAQFGGYSAASFDFDIHTLQTPEEEEGWDMVGAGSFGSCKSAEINVSNVQSMQRGDEWEEAGDVVGRIAAIAVGQDGKSSVGVNWVC